jgi:hypothetical protein
MRVTSSLAAYTCLFVALFAGSRVARSLTLTRDVSRTAPDGRPAASHQRAGAWSAACLKTLSALGNAQPMRESRAMRAPKRCTFAQLCIADRHHQVDAVARTYWRSVSAEFPFRLKAHARRIL